MSVVHALDRHGAGVLQFSGGKDSLACLHLLRGEWGRITVLWVNSGDAFPETIAQMQEVRAQVPHFLEVLAKQPEQIAAHGYPADVFSTWGTTLGQKVMPGERLRVQSPLACCAANLWRPADLAVRSLGATLVIRGQRADESRRNPIASGMLIDGVEYQFPLEAWSGQQVRDYLAENAIALPPNYAEVDSSLDCQHCTGYLDENAGKFRYLQAHHPALHGEVVGRVRALTAAAEFDLRHARAIVRGH